MRPSAKRRRKRPAGSSSRRTAFNQRYEKELMNPREALSLGSISEIVMPGDLRAVLGRNLQFLLAHYQPGPWETIQREFH